MIPSTAPPSYKASQTYHYASDATIDIFDINTARGIRSTRQGPTRSEIHFANMDNKHQVDHTANIGNEPQVPGRRSCVQWLVDVPTAVRTTTVIYGLCSAGIAITLLHDISRDCASTPELTMFLNFLGGAVLAIILTQVPTWLGMHRIFPDAQGARGVFQAVGWAVVLVFGRAVGVTWIPPQCKA